MILDFDKYSLKINGQSILIRSAALHYFRSPGVNVWKDRLSKLKAGGYNAVDLYFYWGYHSKQPGIYDFTDIRDLRELLDITVDLGLYVIARPGPYINAEVSAGGFPTWLFNVPDVKLRNREAGNFVFSSSYMDAVKEWYSRIIPIINEYQNIIAFQIENEYSTNAAEPDYIQDLYDIARAMGVQAPIFHNDAFAACLYSDIINIYAFDVYPTINFNYDWRDNPYTFGTLDNVDANLRECIPDSPLFIAELQSGWFDKWGGFGYDYIREQLSRKHINIVTKTALSQGVTMFNHFLGCGGTSWGNLASDEVYSSYDFAAPISEYGIPQNNYYKAKEINYFLQTFNLSSTDLIASEDTILKEYDEKLYAKLRQDNINNCQWLFVRNLDKIHKTLRIQDKYDLNLKTFDMKILPLELDLLGCKLNFSSLPIFGRLNGEDYEIIFLLLDNNSELIISDYSTREISDEIKAVDENDTLKLSFKNIPEEDLAYCKVSRQGRTTKFIFIKEETADKTWLLENHALIGPDFLLDNPYKAAFNEKREVKAISSDNPEWQSRNIDIGSSNIDEISKNLNNLEWKTFTCAPEIDPDYDYSSWDFVKSNNDMDCISNRIYDEFIWYKGSFKGDLDQIRISAKHCYAIYLNGVQVFCHDTLYMNRELDELITLNLDNKYFNHGGNNEITVLVQNLGFDKGFENSTNLPRGILSFSNETGKKIEWQIRGGLAPEIEEWDFMPEDNLDDSSINSHLIWAGTRFEHKPAEGILYQLSLNLDSSPFNKANIYLNGNLIGRYWRSMGPQVKFYLMDGFLKENNLLSLIIWDRSDANKIGDYKFDKNNVIINIEVINLYHLIALNKLL